jgi:hypothetical protein
VSATIKQEGTYQAELAEEEKVRKRDLLGPLEHSTKGAPPKYCLVYTPSAGKSRVPPPPPQWDHHPPLHQKQQVLPQTLVQSPQPVLPPAPQEKITIVSVRASNVDVSGTSLGSVLNPKKAKHQDFQHQW